MSEIGAKQSNVSKLAFESFATGLDFRKAQTEIAQTALFKANNMEFDSQTGLLRKCDGIVSVYDAGEDVGSGFTFNGHQLFTVGQTLKRINLTTNTVTTVGTLLGAAQPQYTLWTDCCLISSGGTDLQKLSASFVLSTLSNSPPCNASMMRESRIMAWVKGDDFLYYSAVGDPTTWDLSPIPDADWSAVTSSTAAYIEIGYQDGLDIVAVQVLADDLIIFKSDGNVYKTYRLKNKLPDWVVEEVTAVSALTAQAALNDIFVIGSNGFQSVVNTQKYGDIEQYDVGKKVNPVLSKTNKDSNARVWFVPTRNQMIVKLANDKNLWLFHYSMDDGTDMGAWTKRLPLKDVMDVWVDGNKVYFAYGQHICEFDDSIATELGRQRLKQRLLFQGINTIFQGTSWNLKTGEAERV